jgi:hypothetical protein
LFGTLKEGDHTEGVDVGVRIILSLKEWGMRVVTWRWTFGFRKVFLDQ